jgi:hypothetical protein
MQSNSISVITETPTCARESVNFSEQRAMVDSRANFSPPAMNVHRRHYNRIRRER